MNQILPLLFQQLAQYTVNNPYTHKSAMSLMGPGLSFWQTWQDSDKVSENLKLKNLPVHKTAKHSNTYYAGC